MHNESKQPTGREDGPHLNPQLDAVWQAVRDGAWRGLEEIAALAECPPASASARLRDLRKAQFGGWDVERAYAGNKSWRYRVRDKAAADAAGGIR
jgi:hypothetical protein